MIVTIDEAIQAYERLPKEKKSFCYHPLFLIEDIKNRGNVELCFFLIKESESLFYYAFYKGRIPNTVFYDIESPSNYGGPIILGNEDFREQSTQTFLKWCKDAKVMVEFTKFHPVLENHNTYYGERIFNRETVVVDLVKEDIIRHFSTRIRTAIKKAIKEKVKIVISKERKYIQEFIKIYNSLMSEKNTSQHYFFPTDYYESLLKNEKTILVSAINENEEVIASSIFFLESEITEYHLSAATEEGRYTSATHLIIYEFIRYAQQNGAKLLYLGGGNSTEPTNSLLFFKKGFSKRVMPFYIGYQIHFKEEYEALKAVYSNPKTILFYR